MSQPVEAGVAAVVAGLVRAQLDRGWSVAVACPDGALAETVRRAGARVLRWEAGRAPDRRVAQEVSRLRRAIDGEGPDVVHLHSAKAGLAGRLALLGSRPTLYQPHAWSFDAVEGLTAVLARRWERLASRWTDVLVCVSEAELRLGRAVGYRGTAEVVTNGVDLDRWRVGDRARARMDLGLEAGAPLVVCVGRITEQKGQDMLLAAWSRLAADLPHARLALVGDGPRAAEWRGSFGDERIVWVGAADPAPWYTAADVVAVPSRWEGMPLVTLEAMASARAVVAFDVTGVRESLGPVGTVVQAGDVRALADTLTLRLTQPEVAAAAGVAGRRRVEQEFGLTAATDALCRITESVVGRERAGSRQRNRRGDARSDENWPA